MRKLFFTTGSPFARAVRIVLVEKGLDFEREETFTTPSVEERAKVAPTLQVPTLVDGDLTLWDSSVNCNGLGSGMKKMFMRRDAPCATSIFSTGSRLSLSALTALSSPA